MTDEISKDGLLLVLGNGFDLSLNVNSRYSDYFESEFFRDKRNKIENLAKSSKKYPPQVFSLEHINGINCWDIYFYLYYKLVNQPTGNWCDLEKWIKDSFKSIDRYNTVYKEKHFFWDAEFRLVELCHNRREQFDHYYSQANEIYRAVFTYFLYCETEIENLLTSEYYQFLLSELKEFEKSFGAYIKLQTDNCEYTKSAQERIKKLSNGKKARQIDTFNYSECSRQIPVRFINGNSDNPIFGINILKGEELDHVYKFSKTARRIEQDSFGLSKGNKDEITFNHVIVFGHSLNKQDYDYFCYLFTRLNFSSMDVDKMGTIEFTFDVYDKDKSEQIRRNYSESVYALINFYEDLINPGRQSILLNLLRFSSKLIIREVDFNQPLPKERPIATVIDLA